MIDCGASHNFISKNLVDSLQLWVEETKTYLVKVGNGHKVKCQEKCAQLRFYMQQLEVIPDFYLFGLGGMDLVLKLKWLASLGEVKADFGKTKLTLKKGNSVITIVGDPALNMIKLSYGAFMQVLLEKRGGLRLHYDTGQGLPPSIRQDHAIHLKNGAKFWFNSNYNNSTRISPFQALYEREPPILLKATTMQDKFLDFPLEDKLILLGGNTEVLRKMGKYTGISSECAIPTDSRVDLPIAKRAPIMAQVIIGTPGTIKKWMTFKKLGVTRLKILVFDEADQMLAEDGFKDDSLRIMKEIEKVNSNCQVVVIGPDWPVQPSTAYVDDLVYVENWKLFPAVLGRGKSGPTGLDQPPTIVLPPGEDRLPRRHHRYLFLAVAISNRFLFFTFSDGEVLLFSATFNDIVKNFVSRTVKKDHNKLFVKKEELSLDAVKQYKVHCPDELSKIEVIKDYIFEIGENVGQTIIFVRTRESAKMLHKSLVDLGYEVTSIQGALDHEERDKIVKEFKDGLTQVLISTDVLARGFDQQQINLVINYDLPVKHTPEYNTREREPDYEVYLHRVGRAGRFGRKGAVFNLICGERDERLMSKIENHFGTHVTEVKEKSVEDYKGALKEAGLLQ
ncbi:hypothetical protein Lal_00037620 [Lupinus albus]|nr:hypothetical protein Lal_00037620 [Lupinus albus]